MCVLPLEIRAPELELDDDLGPLPMIREGTHNVAFLGD